MEDDKKDVKEDMTLNIEIRGEDNSVVKFKISRVTPMQKIFVDYCNRKNLSRTTLKFMINDKIINGTDTAQTLMLKNGDVINVFHQVCYVQSQSEHVNLYVHCDGHEVVSIKILRTSRMQDLFDVYATRRNVAKDELGYMFNGYEIYGTDTPLLLRLQSGHIIDAHEKSNEKLHDVVNIEIHADGHAIVKFKIQRSASMQKIFDAYCGRRNVSKRDLRFMFDGQRVNGRDTPRSLNLQDGDILEAYQELDGGRYY